MYNFGIASTLKTWFDYVLRAAITFKYTESGAVGLLEGKRAIVIETRGGLYSEGPAQMMDSQEPHLRHLLSFMGITNVKFFRAEKLAFGSGGARTGHQCRKRTTRRSDSERSFRGRIGILPPMQHAS
jgi:FMN-dependent NADH-azoreductase